MNRTDEFSRIVNVLAPEGAILNQNRSSTSSTFISIAHGVCSHLDGNDILVAKMKVLAGTFSSIINICFHYFINNYYILDAFLTL